MGVEVPGKSPGFGGTRPGFGSQLCCLKAVQTWAGGFPSLQLGVSPATRESNNVHLTRAVTGLMRPGRFTGCHRARLPFPRNKEVARKSDESRDHPVTGPQCRPTCSTGGQQSPPQGRLLLLHPPTPPPMPPCCLSPLLGKTLSTSPGRLIPSFSCSSFESAAT